MVVSYKWKYLRAKKGHNFDDNGKCMNIDFISLLP